MVSESSPRAWSVCNRRCGEWRLAMNHLHAGIKCTASSVTKMLWGSTALP
jgi:hypothetical protein